METLIYRGKNLITGQWIEGDLIQSKPHADGGIISWILSKTIHPLGVITTPTNTFKEVRTDTVGLISEYYINGKQCCVGDIYSGDKYIYIVKFRKGAFYLDHHKKYLGEWGLLSRMMDDDFKGIRSELIHKGNIYDNSDLLS